MPAFCALVDEENIFLRARMGGIGPESRFGFDRARDAHLTQFREIWDVLKEKNVPYDIDWKKRLNEMLRESRIWKRFMKRSYSRLSRREIISTGRLTSSTTTVTITDVNDSSHGKDRTLYVVQL